MEEERRLSSDEIRNLRKLLDVEEIKDLRLKYSYCMDARDLENLVQLFADDAVCRFGPYGEWGGRDNILKGYKETFEETLTTPFAGMHISTNHLVEISDPSTARGRAYLSDVITKNEDGSDIEEGKSNFLWFALYDERYVKLDGVWKIKVMDLHFFWPDRQVSEDVVKKFF